MEKRKRKKEAKFTNKLGEGITMRMDAKFVATQTPRGIKAWHTSYVTTKANPTHKNKANTTTSTKVVDTTTMGLL